MQLLENELQLSGWHEYHIMRHSNCDVSLKYYSTRVELMFNLVLEDRLLVRAAVHQYHGRLYCLLSEFCADLQHSDACYDAGWQA